MNLALETTELQLACKTCAGPASADTLFAYSWTGHSRTQPHQMKLLHRYAPANTRTGASASPHKLGQYHCWNREYDPATGRWTTPDPAASPFSNLNEYAEARPTALIDSSGLWIISKGLTSVRTGLQVIYQHIHAGDLKLGNEVTIKISRPGPERLHKDKCGGIYIPFDFYVAHKSQGAPCDGYIIQKNDLTNEMTSCGQPANAPTRLTFYEAFPIRKGDNYWQPHKVNAMKNKVQGGVANTDTVINRDMPETFGSFAVIGELKFFCQSVTGFLGSVDFAGNWKNGLWKSGTDNGLPGGMLPTSRTEPIWWALGKSNGKRSVSVNWDCCPPKGPHTLKVDP